MLGQAHIRPSSVSSVPTSSRDPGLRPATLALPATSVSFWGSTRRRLACLQLPLSTADPLAKTMKHQPSAPACLADPKGIRPANPLVSSGGAASFLGSAC
ncbi:hypothetical protein CGRA01v4_10352 [Colletotrichum graminicola]|nr:hypothetical protein CGRA01v4_10352 [Colletotrichum graminicola]